MDEKNSTVRLTAAKMRDVTDPKRLVVAVRVEEGFSPRMADIDPDGVVLVARHSSFLRVLAL